MTRLELLEPVKTLEHFLIYLHVQEFHVRTEHSVLICLLSFRNLEGQTARGVQRLQECKFISGHRHVAGFLETNVFLFGVPMELHSDQGRNFESRLMQEVLDRLGVSKIRTTPHTPAVR